MYDEPLDTALLGLLGDNYWGEQATAVYSFVRSFLVAAWAAREAAVAARGPTAVLEVALDAEPEPAPLSVLVRVPVGPVAGAAWGAGDQICADCHSRWSAGSKTNSLPPVNTVNWRWVEEGDGCVGRLQPPGQPLGVGLPNGLQCLVPYPYRR
jgi:hypothetical protein